jgi:hypothetical protein
MAINDKFFAPFTRTAFRTFAHSAARLVKSSREVTELVETTDGEAPARAAE